MPSVDILACRDHSTVSDPLNPIYLAGFCAVGVVVLSLAIWLLIHFWRKHSATKREESRGAAFLSVRGLVSEQDEKGQITQVQDNGLSRGPINSSVVLPHRAVTCPPKTREEVVEFHCQTTTFPQSFSARPFAFALSAGSPASPSSPTWSSSLSFGSNPVLGSHLSVCSIVSANSSVGSNPTVGAACKVQQMFNPVLPDELLPSRVGEELTVVQSFGDGWCLVGRQSNAFATTTKSLFREEDVQNDVELGVVPAWCFLKPIPGLSAERPVRSSSLGIAVQTSGPSFSSRDDVRSWSNF